MSSQAVNKVSLAPGVPKGACQASNNLGEGAVATGGAVDGDCTADRGATDREGAADRDDAIGRDDAVESRDGTTDPTN